MLTAAKVKNARPAAKAFKLFDGRGLFLLVKPSGAKAWRFKYRYGGVEKLLGMGTYPDVSLARAREKRRDARDLLDRGIDPSAQRQEAKRAERAERIDADSFRYVALEHLLLQAGRTPPRDKAGDPVTLTRLEELLGQRLTELVEEGHAGAGRAATLATTRRRLAKYVDPWLGARRFAEIDGSDVLEVIRRIEGRGTHETARRTLTAIGRVCKYAVATGRARYDAAASIDRSALVPVKARHFAAITDPARIGGMLRAIDGYEGHPAVTHALKLAPLVFVRPGELRAAEWSEIDLDAEHPVWRIPGERMKMRQEHVVPLSTQAAAVLASLHPITGAGRYVFPSVRTPRRCMSENTLNAALRRMGYSKDEMTAHGFRAMASTRLNELGFSVDVIERQLAHAERNKVRAAYNRAEYIAERRAMMQAWADYLDGLRAGKAKVTAIREGRRRGA